MKLVAIDSSGMVASVAILEEDQLLAEYTIHHKKTHSQTLLPMLDEIVGMVELEMNTIDAIAVAAGPGSFTGLRIGAATAKGLGLALQKPLLKVSTLAGLAGNLYQTQGLVCPVMDARRRQVYTGLYRWQEGGLLTVEEDTAIPAAELVEKINGYHETVTFVGDGIPVLSELLQESLEVPYAIAPAHLNRQRASSIGVLGMKLLRAGKVCTAEEFAPEYLRVPQAERERLQRMQPVIRKMEIDDLEQIMPIEESLFTPPWTHMGFFSFLIRDDTSFWVAEKDGTIVGYCGALLVLDEADITNVAVSQEQQKQGIGTVLLDTLLRELRERRIRTVHLEVRQSNTAAIALYEHKGFEHVGLRKEYYEEPVEDACTMQLIIKENEEFKC
ncbi:MAG: tRNA (adenosine(37)-N6)-threonylcarbamoyltransferase complex dimerization subunit type 1 TsaB [Lachnospiraceae bacterium]